MENAEERKKMKKIEKEEQLKKKLEQTMEEKMAADSKTVEGESAVVKAEEGNTATEQEPEAAPALSEEELNAMYERFQQRLQKEGLADAEGNPTEKTLEIRRQIVERKVEREKQAERQKKIAKRAKTTKHWVQTAKAAGVVLVVGACVFGASMTSEANRIRLVETISGVRNSGDTTWVDNGEDRKYTAEDWDKVKEEIKIEYNGEMLAMRTIAQRVGTTGDTLKRYYEQTGDIYEAIKQYYQKKDEYESGRIEYKGELKFLRTIAKDEGVAETTLRRYYKKYGNIDKAVYMAKIQRSRNQKVTIRNTELSLSDLSIVLGIKESELLNMLNSGMKIDDIKKLETEKPRKSPMSNKKLVLPNGQSLLEYCIENGLNFSCIYYSIHTYGKTMEEAIKHYREKGQEIPSSWIYEKYGILLKHLLLNNNINSQRVVSYMRKENISLNDALEEYVLRKNSKEANVDYDWMHELYSVLTDENMKDEYDAFKNTFYVTDQEEECIIKSYDEIENLQRKLLLYEIAEAFKANVFEETEKEELLKIYEVTEDEVETIFLDFYNYFENKIKLTEKEQRRKEEISDIAKKWYYLSGDERKDILDINNVTNYEQSVIEKLSQNITKYKNIINARGNKKMEGISFNEE